MPRITDKNWWGCHLICKWGHVMCRCTDDTKINRLISIYRSDLLRVPVYKLAGCRCEYHTDQFAADLNPPYENTRLLRLPRQISFKLTADRKLTVLPLPSRNTYPRSSSACTAEKHFTSPLSLPLTPNQPPWQPHPWPTSHGTFSVFFPSPVFAPNEWQTDGRTLDAFIVWSFTLAAERIFHIASY